MLAPPHRGGATPLQYFVLNAHFASTKRRRPDCVVLLLYPFFAPLSHEIAALPTQFPTPNTFNVYFSRTSQANSLFLASTSATSHFPLAPFFMTSHAMAQFLHRVSSPLFVAFSTGHLGAFLGPSWAIFGGRLGSIRGHLGAVFLLFSILRAARPVVLP